MENGDSLLTLNPEKFNPLHPVISMQVLHTVHYTFPLLLIKENLCSNNQELLEFEIVSFILMTLMCDSGVILLGEIRCWSHVEVKE